MQGKSYKADCTLPRENLRYIHVLHVGFDNQVHEGELVVNKDIADDVLEIFKELYESGYQIEKVRLVDEYDADDEASMSDNNSSAFNFRFISHTTKISKHGMGMAVDINTLYNPYVKTVDGEQSIEPANAADYVDRSKDFCTRLTMMIYAISCLWSMVLSGEAIGSIPRIISILKIMLIIPTEAGDLLLGTAHTIPRESK